MIEYDGRQVKSVKKAIRRGCPPLWRPLLSACFPTHRRSLDGSGRRADEKISQVLGHTSTRITETVYARYSPAFMADAMAALDW